MKAFISALRRRLGDCLSVAVQETADSFEFGASFYRPKIAHRSIVSSKSEYFVLENENFANEREGGSGNERKHSRVYRIRSFPDLQNECLRSIIR